MIQARDLSPGWWYRANAPECALCGHTGVVLMAAIFDKFGNRHPVLSDQPTRCPACNEDGQVSVYLLIDHGPSDFSLRCPLCSSGARHPAFQIPEKDPTG